MPFALTGRRANTVLNFVAVFCMSSMAALCALSLWAESMHFSTDSISVRYCFTDCCAARISCSVAVEGSGKALGALGPWQLSAKPRGGVQASPRPRKYQYRNNSTHKAPPERKSSVRTCTHEGYRPHLRKDLAIGRVEVLFVTQVTPACASQA